MKVPGYTGDPRLDEIIGALKQAANGRCNAVGSVTLNTGATTTTITDAAIQKGDWVELSPVDTNAAAEDWCCEDGAAAAGSITITHANAGTTRKFKYRVCGK